MRILLAALLLVACDDGRPVADAGLTADAGPGDAGDPDIGGLFVDIQYATRCPDDSCASVDRDICGVSGGTACGGLVGEGDVVASCTAVEEGGGQRLAFSANTGADFGIEVSGLVVSSAGGVGGASCTVRVDEGGTVYEGRCGPVDPGTAQPCQIRSVAFFDDSGNPTFEGQVECRGLPGADGTIDVTAVGSGPSSAAAPGVFRVANCNGLDL